MKKEFVEKQIVYVALTNASKVKSGEFISVGNGFNYIKHEDGVVSGYTDVVCFSDLLEASNFLIENLRNLKFAELNQSLGVMQEKVTKVNELLDTIKIKKSK